MNQQLIRGSVFMTTEKVQLPALNFQYTSASPTIWNNGHTVQVNLPAAGSKLTVGEQAYELLQLHFHTPSEETFSGRHYPMVAHFVHKPAGERPCDQGKLVSHEAAALGLAAVA